MPSAFNRRLTDERFTPKKRAILFIMLICMSFSVFGFNSSLEETELRPTDTAILEIATTVNPERGDPYTADWYDNSSILLQSDSGSF